jgi:hypothetical protein
MPDQLLQACKNRVVETSIGGKKTVHSWHNEYLLKFKDETLEIYNNKINKLLLAQKVSKLKISSEKNGSFPWCLLGDGIKVLTHSPTHSLTHLTTYSLNQDSLTAE